MSRTDLEEIRKYYVSFNNIRTVEMEEIASVVTRSMAHFYTQEFSTQLIAEMQVDWFNVLKEFTAQNINAAFTQWISEQTKRPTPADIRKICESTQDRAKIVKRMGLILKHAKPVEEEQPETSEKQPSHPEWTWTGFDKISRLGKQQNILNDDILIAQKDYYSTGMFPKWAQDTENKETYAE